MVISFAQNGTKPQRISLINQSLEGFEKLLDQIAHYVPLHHHERGINSIQLWGTNLDTAFVPPLSIQLSQRSFHIPRS